MSKRVLGDNTNVAGVSRASGVLMSFQGVFRCVPWGFIDSPGF